VIVGRLKELARHSAIYGVGSVVSSLIAVFLLPLYTRYLTRADYGAIETLVAASAVLTIFLQAGINSAFFRFYFDSGEPEERTRVVRTSFWFTMGGATVGLAVGVLLAPEISSLLFATDKRAGLVRAAAVLLWANLNYQQMTSLFRVEQRSVAYVIASLTNVSITIGATILLVVGLHKGATGALVGNFAGTLCVYFPLLVYRRFQLGLQFDRHLLRRMNAFGLPLVPSALALWVNNFSDRLFLVKLSGAAEVGLYSIGIRVSSAIVLLLTAFRTAWPAFAYSIDDEREARTTYGYVLTYVLLIVCWSSLALGALAPWIVHLLTTTRFYSAQRVVALLAFSNAAMAGFMVVSIGIGRARRTRFNWIITGSAAVVNIALNVALIPPYGMIGAAIATLVSFTFMFAFMAWHAQRVYPVPYQWRRVAILVSTAAALSVVAALADAPLPLAIVLAVAYPLVLLPLGFYLPAERTRLRRLVPLLR
jgi:O-antigen/teichoic acid export membrane protein